MLKKLTILWTAIGASYWAIYIHAMLNKINPMGAGLIAVLCFMTASIIHSLGGRK